MKDKITLDNASFKWNSSKESADCIMKGNRIYKNSCGGFDNFYYYVKNGEFKGSYRPPIDYRIISPSDYLQLLTSQPSRLTEEDLITFDKIKKGDMFECIERVILKPSGEIAFIKGKVYTCEEPTRLLDEQGMHHQLYSVEFINRHFKLAPQPPVMEGKKETLQDVIKRVSPFGTMTISNPKMLIALEDFIGQKTSSLQSEVEQLKGLLKEAQPFCGTMLRGKIEHYTSK